MASSKVFQFVTATAVLLAFFVIVLGAYVRLSDAGLGCPDWPGCYGQILVPSSDSTIEQANHAFPERPLEAGKAWKEMLHRYFASFLGLLILVMAVSAWLNRNNPLQQKWLPSFLLLLVMFQGALGMWTVTLLLKPAIVTLHLLAGMMTLALLWFVGLKAFAISRLSSQIYVPSKTIKVWALLAMAVVYGQIALGGWTSTNYVALHCWDFPTCQGKWLPETDFSEGFTLWRGLGQNYEGGVLSNAAGVAVHFSHRLGALITLILVGGLSIMLLRGEPKGSVKVVAGLMFVLLLLQITLGISNVLLRLPTLIAVAHNGVAALLFLLTVSLNYLLFSTPEGEKQEGEGNV
ncbi:MAG: COX15/CtaA family protein [Gammaproteobacteria bacterium]|nr:COX15/CtaA family protein [Gammaproteobacteria bacterium]